MSYRSTNCKTHTVNYESNAMMDMYMILIIVFGQLEDNDALDCCLADPSLWGAAGSAEQGP